MQMSSNMDRNPTSGKETGYTQSVCLCFLPIRLKAMSGYLIFTDHGRTKGVCVKRHWNPGMKAIKNKDGVRNSHTSHAEVMFSLDGKPQEKCGLCHWRRPLLQW